MQEIPLYQVDAFTDQPFSGNPAAVCPVQTFPTESLMQRIAQENNLSETAFIVPASSGTADYQLRWFTPVMEVQLCGHATLAGAHIVFTHLHPEWDRVRFDTASGVLTVVRRGDRYEMDFPSLHPYEGDTPKGLGAAMGHEPLLVCRSDRADRDLMLVYDNAEIVQNMRPNMEALKAFAPFGFIATAPGEGSVDFVSRCFFPNHGIAEDPVTGSAHCVSAPYWAERLGKANLRARQVSARGGDLWLVVEGDRVKISGQAVEVLRGTLFF